MNNFRRKLGKLKRTPFLRIGHFRRILVNIGEIEAHSFFENLPFSTKIGENWLKLVEVEAHFSFEN